MPPSTTVDIKLSFEQYDMTPGVKGRKFITNLRVHGGKCDAQGYSLADVFARLDEGAQASNRMVDIEGQTRDGDITGYAMRVLLPLGQT